MKSPFIIGAAVMAAIAAGLAAASCAGEKSTTVVTGGSANDVGIAVTGVGEVVVTPDVGFFEVGVQATAASVATAREAAARGADAVISSLKKNGVDAKDIRTAGFNIQPQYGSPTRDGEPRIIGYQVFNTVSVKVRKLDNFSKIIDDATDAGGDLTRVSGVRFGLEDDQKAVAEARNLAVEDARKKAEQLAKATGTKLGDPLSITEFSGGQPELLAADSFAPKVAGAATPIETGTGKVVVNVQVRWAIAR